MEIGAQLFTMRNFIQQERDIEYTLQKIAEIGYKTVQVSAIGKIAPERLREICDQNDLKIVLTHTSPDRILYETEAVIREHRILGCDYIGLGAMPEKYRDSEFLPRFMVDYGEAAKKIAASGKLLMYHNHNFEFEKINGKRIIETLMESFAPEELGFTLDTYWVQAAGADVCCWLEKLKGRIPCIHLKDMTVHGFKSLMAPVLEGNMNFVGILETIKKLNCTKYLLVICMKKSYDNLAKLGWK
ncbi:MAG: sugar phosphate isomerase/epimerase [Oscillospiraceae bacterium]